MVRDNTAEAKSLKLCRCVCRLRCECLVKRKKKPHPPFNSGVSIGSKRGMHPKLGLNSGDSGPPPGSYDPNPIVGNYRGVTSWEREEAAKEFAATMGGRIIDKYVEQRELVKFGLGPGTHELKQWPQTALEKSHAVQNRETGFTAAPRFEKSSRRETPGPGYAGKQRSLRFKSFSSRPTFEFDGLQPRFKKPLLNWSIACNRYNPQHPESLDKILKKVTGQRGPYDLFTGPRNSSTLFGYQTRGESTDSVNWPAKLPTEFEKAYGAGRNRYKGVWTDCPRFPKKPTLRLMLEDISLCYKDPDSPAPGSYSPVSSPKSMTRTAIHPFNNSVKNARPLRPYDISPGPGTYGLNTEKRVCGNGWTSTFVSKVQRRLGPRVDQYNSF